MSKVYSYPVSGNIGVREFVTNYNRFADYLAQQPNGGTVKAISFYDVKISSFMKTNNVHVYCGMLSDGIAIYLREDTYGRLNGVLFSYSITPRNKSNAENEIYRRGEILGAAISLSLFTMGIPLNMLEEFTKTNSGSNELFDVMEKSWRDKKHSYSMNIYNPTNRKNMIFTNAYDEKSQRFMATIIYK